MSNTPDNNEEHEEQEELSITEMLELKKLESSMESETTESQNSMTFAELYSSLLLCEEIILTVPEDAIPKIKQGLKNYKAKNAIRNKEQGLPADNSYLSFKEVPSQEIVTAVDLIITLVQKSSFPVLGIRIPDNEL